MKAIITVDVPEHQIGQEVSVYFKDTMCVNGTCESETEVYAKHDEEIIKETVASIWGKPCADAVSRQAVLSYIGRILNQGTGKQKSFEFIQKFVERLPSVQPKTKTGKWIENPNAYECSECQIIRAKGMTGKYNFCPNCGARMESEVRNEV